MNISQALKLKNKLGSEIKELEKLINKSNSYIEGTPVRFETPSLLLELLAKRLHLVDLKAKIHKANAPVYEDIFRLSELKAHIAFLNNINTAEGPQKDRYTSSVSNNNSLAQIDGVKVREMVKAHQKEIDEIQEKLDSHNALTSIEV